MLYVKLIGKRVWNSLQPVWATGHPRSCFGVEGLSCQTVMCCGDVPWRKNMRIYADQSKKCADK